MSVASYSILKIAYNYFYHSVFFSFLMFSYKCMSMQMRSFVYSSLGQRAISQLLVGTMLGSPGYMAAEI